MSRPDPKLIFIYRTFLIILLLILFAIYFSPASLVHLITGGISDELNNLYFEHRMQAMALFVGIGLIIGGLIIVKKREMSYEVSLFGKRSDIKMKGKESLTYGIGITIIGTIATVWSLFFWVKYVFPVIFT
jgi:hypothetical protein